MRRTTHRPTLALAAGAVLALALAGCGSQSGSGSGSSGTVSPSPTTSASGTPSKPGCTAKATLGAADSGGTFCLATGNTIRVSLDGTRSRPWTPVKADGSGLQAANSGFVLQPGDASSAFKAVSAGTVRLTASRPLCATAPHKISCKGILEWTVTVVVTKP